MKGTSAAVVTLGLLISSAATLMAAEKPALPGNWSDAVPIAEGAAQYFVAPDGKAENPGTKDAPWDIASGLAGEKHPVKPGDILWIRGGTYKQPDRKHGTLGLPIKLCGTEKAPIHIRTYPGERATIDGGITLWGAQVNYVWVWDLEIMLSDRGDEVGVGGSHPEGLPGPQGGVHTAGNTGCKIINLDIHDVYQGISFWEASVDNEIHGCLIHDNGWKAPDRNHGHAIYTQNNTGHKTISGCILSTAFGKGQEIIQAYGSKAAKVNGFRIEDNICCDAVGSRLLIGGQISGSKDNQALRNYLYKVNLQMGYSGKDLEDGKAIGNTVFNSGIQVNHYKKFELRDNLVVGGGVTVNADCTEVTNEGNQAYATGKHPDAPKVVLLPNKYDPTRANLAIFNWTNAAQVQVPVAGFLKPGDHFRLMDPKKFYDKPLFEGDCAGDTVTVPVSSEFAAFVVLKGDAPK